MKTKLKQSLKVYEDAEDSWLLQKALLENIRKDAAVLDVGTGTGILAITAALKGADVTATDINFDACKLACENAELNGVKINIACCDLANAIKEKFDLVVFNPPYLPNSEFNDASWSGGEAGVGVICRFLEDVKRILKINGMILFVFSSLGDIKKLKKKIRELSFRLKILKEQKFFFEKLFVGKLVLGPSKDS